MTTLYNYQNQGVTAIEAFDGRCLLADDMGLGKSVQAITYAVNNDLFPCLVVCPANLKLNWAYEWTKHYGIASTILFGKKREKKPRTPVSIINYDILGDRVEELKALGFKLLIGDEGHYLQSRASIRTKAFKALSRSIEKLVIATGTPIVNRPSDLWPMLNCLLPKEFPNFYVYARRYTKPKKTYWGWTYNGASHLQELHEILLNTCMVRRLKKDVLKELPERMRRVIPLEINRKAYVEASKDFKSWLQKNSPDKLGTFKKAEGLNKVNQLKQLVGKLKLPGVISWCDDFLENQEKLIVFGFHIEFLEKLKSHFKSKCVLVHGGVKSSSRQDIVNRFNSDSKVRVFLGQIRAAGSGWSCTSTSDTAVGELDWTPGVLDQALSRTHGIGRGAGRGSVGHLLVAADTIEEKLLQTLEKKSKNINSAIDGGEAEELDVFTEFCKTMEEL